MFGISLSVIAPVVWWVVAWSIAAALVFRALSKSKGAAALEGRRGALVGGLLAVAASPVPSMLQYVFGEQRGFWAGLPLLTLGAGLIVYAVFARGAPRAPAPRRFSFRQKSTAVAFLAILAVYGWFSIALIGAPTSTAVAFGALIGSTVLITLIMIASHIVLAVAHPPERTDERDRIVELRSAYAGHWVLAFGVWGGLLLALAQAPYAIIAYALMGAFVLSELVRLGSELLHYRHGA